MKKLKHFLIYFTLGINLVALAALYACCLITHLNPAEYPKVSLVTLFFPIILGANLLFVVYWLLVRWKLTLVPLVGMAFCWTFIRSYVPLNSSRSVPQGALSILSYNTRYWGQDGRMKDSTNAVVEFLKQQDVDVLCLQESGVCASFKALKQALEAKGYDSYEHSGQVIFARLPIVSRDTLSFCHDGNGGVMAEVVWDGDTVLVVNYHFESNKLSTELKTAYQDALDSYHGDSIQKEMLPLLKLMAQAAPYRAAQVDSMALLIDDQMPRSLVVCGDFNDTPVSYTIHTLTKQLTSAYTQSGCGLGFTFHERGFPVRIDHILFDGATWQSHHTEILKDCSTSDHFAIRTFLSRKKNP